MLSRGDKSALVLVAFGFRFDFGVAGEDAAIGFVARRGDSALIDCLANGAAGLDGMAAIREAAGSQEIVEFHKALAERFGFDAPEAELVDSGAVDEEAVAKAGQSGGARCLPAHPEARDLADGPIATQA